MTRRDGAEEGQSITERGRTIMRAHRSIAVGDLSPQEGIEPGVMPARRYVTAEEWSVRYEAPQQDELVHSCGGLDYKSIMAAQGRKTWAHVVRRCE